MNNPRNMCVEIEGGKYSYIVRRNGSAEVLRFNEVWRNVTGDKFTYCMATELEDAREQVRQLRLEYTAMKAEWNKAYEIGMLAKEQIKLLRKALTVAINHYAEVGSEHWSLFDAALTATD